MNKVLKGVLSVSGLIIGEELIRKWINMPPEKYSIEWIKALTDSEWETEREIVRQNSCNSKLSISEITRWENLRNLFDKVKSERDWAGRTPTAPSYSREHGHNLYKPD